MKGLVLLLLSILFVLLSINYLVYENYDDIRKKKHSCFTDNAVFDPETSLKSDLKSWCGSKSFGTYEDEDKDDNSSINPNKKCLFPYKRASAEESHSLFEKGWCLIK